MADGPKTKLCPAKRGGHLVVCGRIHAGRLSLLQLAHS